MLSSFRRRYSRVRLGVLRCGFATYQQGLGVSHHQGRRPSSAPQAPPPTPPEKIEWWAVDGELFKAEKFDPKRVLAPLQNDHMPNTKRRKERIKHLGQTRLKLRVHGQESYWEAYMKRFQAMRDEWERHVWDPIPEPVPKPRKPSWVAEESEKYVWKDPRRDAYTFDVSRMDRSAIRSSFDNKIGYKGQGTNQYPVESRRDPGESSSRRPEISPMRRDLYKDSKFDESTLKRHRYGQQGNNTNVARRDSRRFEYDEFEDVFDSKETMRSDEAAATKNKAQSTRHRQHTSLSTDQDEDEDAALFSWDESGSGEDSDADANGDAVVNNDDGDDEDENEDEDDDDEDEVDSDEAEARIQRERSRGPPKKGWYGNEDELFKDD